MSSKRLRPYLSELTLLPHKVSVIYVQSAIVVRKAQTAIPVYVSAAYIELVCVQCYYMVNDSATEFGTLRVQEKLVLLKLCLF